MERTDIGSNIYLSRGRGIGSISLFFVLMITKDIEGMRDLLPEPFDVMDHVGNVSSSIIYGLVAGLYVGRYYMMQKEAPPERIPTKEAIMGVMFASAVLAGITANAISETPAGLILGLKKSTFDQTDLIYGTVTAAAAGLLPTIAQGPHTPGAAPHSQNPEKV